MGEGGAATAATSARSVLTGIPPRRSRRAGSERARAWANGAVDDLGDARVGEWRPARSCGPAWDERPAGVCACGFGPLFRPPSGPSVCALLCCLERAQLGTVSQPAV